MFGISVAGFSGPLSPAQTIELVQEGLLIGPLINPVCISWKVLLQKITGDKIELIIDIGKFTFG